jgi:hypothetical protein
MISRNTLKAEPDKVSISIGGNSLAVKKQVTVELLRQFQESRDDEFASAFLSPSPTKELLLIYEGGRLIAFSEKGHINAFREPDRLEVLLDPIRTTLKPCYMEG